MASDDKIDVVSVYGIVATFTEVGLIYHIGVVDGASPAEYQKRLPVPNSSSAKAREP
jgi:hypothetical protein